MGVPCLPIFKIGTGHAHLFESGNGTNGLRTITDMRAMPVILVWDADYQTRSLVRIILRRQYKVVLAANSAEAVDQFMNRTRSVDLALIDFALDPLLGRM